MDVEPMRCDACLEAAGGQFYVVNGEGWCERCYTRAAARLTPVGPHLVHA